MDIESYRDFCLSLPHTEEGFPFDMNTLVFKVGGKMFALLDVDNFESVNLKCDPEKAVALRERYQAVSPGYHMSKKHWNTVQTSGDVPDELLLSWTKESYALVVKGLPGRVKAELGL